MKLRTLELIRLSKQTQITEYLAELITYLHRNKLSVYLFLILSVNTLFAPVVFAATNQALTHGQSYAIALLILVTIVLAIYLFFVMFFPEKF